MSSEQPPRFDKPSTTGAQPGDCTPAHPPHPFAKPFAHMSRERMLTADELSRFDDISGPVLYSAEVWRIPPFPREDQGQYIARARAGSEAARHRLLLRCLGWTMAKATAVYTEYEPAHSDVMDLVGEANVTMTEALPHALEADDPIKYLMSVGALAMKRYCFYKDPMVKRPRYQPADKHPMTVSMDNGLWPTMQTLPAPALYLVSDETRERESREEHQFVYEALAKLGKRQRQVITAYYGLDGQPARNEHEIALELGLKKRALESTLRRAKTSLARKIAALTLQGFRGQSQASGEA